MTRTRTRLAIVGIALLVVSSAVPLSPSGGGLLSLSPSGGIAEAAEHSFVVEQGNQCYEVSPLRGNEDVVSFYDYRTIGDAPRGLYSSYMPSQLQREDTSRLFLYEGPDGVSLVMIHNANGGDDGDGSAATFRFRGLPSGGSWAVQDDDYGGQDDRFSRNRIDWTWYGDRTDGGAFRGLDRDGTEVTVVPAFDEQAALYDGPVPRSGDTRAWQFLTGSVGNPDAVGLDMNAPVTIRTGHCTPDETAPSAALSGEDGVAGYPVSFDASGSSDNRGIAAYRWDFDGDGEVERTTTDPTVAYEYDENGTYDARVTVVDEAGNADRAQTRVTVDTDDPPNAAFRTGDSPTEGFPVTFDARNASDDVGIAEYRWDFDGDGEVERTTTDPRITRAYDEAGSYEVGLTVVDRGGANATATRTVSVGEDRPPEPAIRVASPEIPTEGQRVVFDAGNSTDDTGISAYRWSFGENGTATATGERVAYAFDGNGTFPVTLEVVDEGGNNATTTTEVEVLPTDETAPNATARANRTNVTAGAPIEFDASDSTDNRNVSAYRWDFGDGTGASSARANHAYGSAGTYDATVTVTDAEGNAATANVTVVVRPPDTTDPAASLAVETNRTETGTEIEFDASNSSDDGGSGVAEYRWDFDGDGEANRTTENPTVDHAYDENGTYDARVTVVDGAGNADAATVTVEVEQNRQAHHGDDDENGGSDGGNSGGRAGGGGGGGGSTDIGPPPTVTQIEERGPNAGLVDVRNARADETVRADLPASEVANRTGVEFRNLRVDLASDDSHFAVETARPADGATDSALPADVTLGSLAVESNYVQSRQVAGVAYEVAVERSRLADVGLTPADLTAYQRAGDSWEQANASVESRGQTVVLRVEADAFAPIAVGAERSVTVADAELNATQVAADEPVSVTATLHNEGEAAAEFAANLTADGEVVATETVEVPAGETEEVTVEESLAPGTHEVGLDATPVGNVTVAEPTAETGIADVSANESAIAPGEQVAITATVENTGSEAGEREVALTLFGEQVATKTVEVPAHETKRVTFVRRIDAAGNYTATVGNASAELSVEAESEDDGPASPDVPVPGFGVETTVAALLAAAALLIVRKRE
ncbi:PKD domain-containing protein [Halorussus salinisoli]|uniref:PKD domain-containing protein n=1 Tax=Halorussus salinisoli TaxID=2558242 RepID=UPI0010C1933B|nr:PKD domain-containing protein [Halorussus salinisoli]